MTLTTREITVSTENGPERRLFVACPQRIDPTPITACAECELCEGLDLEGSVSVRCAVATAPLVEGAPPASAPVTTIMAWPVVCVEQDAAIENVQWLLVSRNIGAVPVVDSRGEPIGILAKTDLLRDRDEPAPSVGLAEDEPPRERGWGTRTLSGATARDVMTPVVRSVLECTSIAETAALMARERVHHVLVLSEQGSLRGIVSTLDVVRWVAARERFAPRAAREA